MFTPALTLILLSTLSAAPVQGPRNPSVVRGLPSARSLEIDGAFTIEVRPGAKPRLTIQGPAEEVQVDLSADRIQLSRVGPSSDPIHLLIELPALESLTLNGAHRLDMPSLVGPRFQLQARGACQIQLAGKVTELFANLTGAIQLNAGSLEARRAEVGAHGSSRAMVKVSERLGVDASGVSHVEYRGRPRQVVPKLSGLASVGTIEV